MKTINSKKVRELQSRIKRSNKVWLEGLDDIQAWYVKFNFGLVPKYYWKEAKSYIFHGYGKLCYYCISKYYFDNMENLPLEESK